MLHIKTKSQPISRGPVLSRQKQPTTAIDSFSHIFLFSYISSLPSFLCKTNRKLKDCTCLRTKTTYY
ncbi:hypothetical protein C5167_030175 [Papaver somniferum]|nr:hypothetical protein C5167_030175 [Papaver somniferum]